MKTLPINSPAFRYIEKSFAAWLDVLGYAPQSVYGMPNYVRGLLHYLEQSGKTEVKEISKENIKTYYRSHLKNRPNYKKAGALSSGHLNKHLQAIYKFCDYLRQSGRLIIPPLNIVWEKKNTDKASVLTEAEVKQLYQACDAYPEGVPKRKPSWFYPAMALRDKAMLAIYYGCGLRRNEGLHIALNDIFWEKQLLCVRNGKNYKERFVPISKAGLKHLENYLYDARPLFIKPSTAKSHAKKVTAHHTSNTKSHVKKITTNTSTHTNTPFGGLGEDTFFINERGHPMQGQMMLLRLNQLVSRTENTELQEKEIGLHTLRHSIATHLLANGMQLERIKDFLGHGSLASTQIYTHLLEQDADLSS